MKEIFKKIFHYLLLIAVAWVIAVNFIPQFQTWWMLVIGVCLLFFIYFGLFRGWLNEKVGTGLYPSIENEIEEIEQELKAGKVTEEEAREHQLPLKGAVEKMIKESDEIILKDFKDSEKSIEMIKKHNEGRGK